VKVPQVNGIYSKPIQGFFQGIFDVSGASIDRPTGIERESKFGRQENLVPLSSAFEPMYIS
jgi:hypothetical protein